MTEPRICDGCEKPIGHNAVDVRLAPGVKVWVHPHRNGYSPRASCIDKALKKDAHCPGCGAVFQARTVGHNGDMRTLCVDCLQALEKAKDLDKEEELHWIALDRFALPLGKQPFTAIIENIPDDDRGWRQSADEYAARLLARAMARGDRHRDNGSYVDGIVKLVPPNAERERWGRDATAGCPAVEVSQEQREAAEEFLCLMAKILQATYTAGIARGRNALAGLARGEVSVRDFEANE